jgi:hypothetical protein
MGASQTPVMRQYFAAKAAHPEALLFFRMGDFYELFYDDAVVAARAFDLTLTARNKGAEEEIPMAGVPHHAASGYVQRLLEKGFKVAICEQMADPSKVKGLVPRRGRARGDAGHRLRRRGARCAPKPLPCQRSSAAQAGRGPSASQRSTSRLGSSSRARRMTRLERLPSSFVSIHASSCRSWGRRHRGTIASARPQAVVRKLTELLTNADVSLDALLGSR